MTNEDKEYVATTIQNEGFDYAFMSYSNFSDIDDEDLEFEIHDCIKSEFPDDNLIFTYVGANSEPYRIIGLPEIEYWEFENSVGTLLENTNIVDAIEYLKKMRTFHFTSLKSNKTDDIKNFKWIE